MNIFALSSYFTNKFLLNEDSKQPSSYFNDFGQWKNVNLPSHKLYAYINKPENAEECVMYLHGHRINRKEALGLSTLLNKLNPKFMYIVPEYRGFGESEDMFDKNEINKDLYSWINFIEQDYKIKKFRIVGHSLGAAIAASFFKYLNYLNTHVSRLVLISTFVDTTSVARSIVEKKSGINLWFIMSYIVPDNVNYDLNYIFDNIDKRNVVVIHGEKDEICDFESTKEMCNKHGLDFVSVNEDHVGVLNSQVTYNKVHN